MVYGVLEFYQLRPSEIFVLGAFVGVEVFLLLQSAGYLGTLHPVMVLSLVIVTSMVITGRGDGAGALAYRPLLGGPRLVGDFRHRRVLFLQDGLRLFESLWRNTFYLSYPSLDFLDRAVPLTATWSSRKIDAGHSSRPWRLLRASFLRQPTRLGMAIRGRGGKTRIPRRCGSAVNRVIALTFFRWWLARRARRRAFGIHYSLVNPYSGFIPGMRLSPPPCSAAS